MKLELKHLAPYLPYELKVFLPIWKCERTISQLRQKSIVTKDFANHLWFIDVKPILRPLSDLTKVNGFSLSDMITHGYHNEFWLPENFEVKYLMHLDFEKLVSWHFDVFGLIEKGLAIDINTI